MPSLTDGEVVQNFQSRALKLSRELESVRRDNAERERELSAAEKVNAYILRCSWFVPVANDCEGSCPGPLPARAAAGGNRSPHSRV